MRAGEQGAIHHDRAADAGAHADREHHAPAASGAVRRLAQTVRAHVADHVHWQVGHGRERVVDALAAPAGQDVRGGDDLASFAVRHARRRDADAGDRHALGLGALKLADGEGDDAVLQVLAAARGLGRDFTAGRHLGPAVRARVCVCGQRHESRGDLGAADVEGEVGGRRPRAHATTASWMRAR